MDGNVSLIDDFDANFEHLRRTWVDGSRSALAISGRGKSILDGRGRSGISTLVVECVLDAPPEYIPV